MCVCVCVCVLMPIHFELSMFGSRFTAGKDNNYFIFLHHFGGFFLQGEVHQIINLYREHRLDAVEIRNNRYNDKKVLLVVL